MTLTRSLNFSKKVVLAASAFALLAVPLTASAANTTVQVDVNGAITAFTTSGTVTLGALTPDATGKQSTNKDIVSVSTNDTAGFRLTLKDADTTYTLADGANSFAASSGTPAAPAALANNTWGWRVDGLGGFGAGPGAALSNAAPSSLTYAAIPANTAAYTINSTSITGTDSVDVWYSARANDTQPSGTYTNIVTYTATVN